MIKKIMFALLVVSFVSGSAFAQFAGKASQVAAKLNTIKLQNIVKRATLAQAQGRLVVKTVVPARFVKTQQVGVLGAFLQKPTAANVCFLNKLRDYKLAHQSEVSAPEMGSWFILGHNGEPPAGKAFYEDQSELARNLNTYYEGRGVVRRGPDGRDVKLYSLPVDGILYKPVGYKDAMVLSSDSHFVIYDMKTQTGKLVENTPQNLRIFSTQGHSGTFDEVLSFEGQVFEIASGEPGPSVTPAKAPAQPAPEDYGDFEEVK